MTEEEPCRLCRNNQATEIDIEKPMYKYANKLLQRLFPFYNIEISILGESPCICQECFERVLQISVSLEKWSKAQTELEEKPLDIDDSKAFQVKKEILSSEDEEMEPPQMDEDDDPPEDKSEESEESEEKEIQQKDPLDPKNIDFFCVGIGHEGLVITKLFKDKTKNTKLMCTCCDEVFENLLQVRMHSPRARKNPSYCCITCCANFPSPLLLSNHEQAEGHRKASNRHRDIDFRCLRCGETFVRFFDSIRHENSMHSSLEYNCPDCHMHFKYFGSFQKHLRFHNPTEPRPDVYDCSFPNCSRRFRVWKRYVKHVSWHKSLSHKCSYATTVTSNLKRHMSSHYKKAACTQEGRFMRLDSMQRVHPDGRKVPYAKRTDTTKGHGQMNDRPVEVIKINTDGEFISLDKQITFKQGRYINVVEKK